MHTILEADVLFQAPSSDSSLRYHMHCAVSSGTPNVSSSRDQEHCESFVICEGPRDESQTLLTGTHSVNALLLDSFIQ